MIAVYNRYVATTALRDGTIDIYKKAVISNIYSFDTELSPNYVDPYHRGYRALTPAIPGKRGQSNIVRGHIEMF